MRVPLGREGWYLCTASDEPEVDDVEFRGDEALAFQMLTQFRNDPILISELRRLFLLPYLNSDPESLEQVASQVASGVWKLRRPAWQLNPVMQSSKPEDSAAFPLEDHRAAASAPASPRPDPPLFPQDADLAAIAAIQKEAAELGIPFCEECAKAAAAGR